MSEKLSAPLSSWLIEPMEAAVAQAIDRLRRAPDVQRVAVMPDVHLATEVCVGTVLGTSRLLYPQAVGGDIGCGMLAVAFDAVADHLSDPATAGRVLAGIGRAVPTLRRHRAHRVLMPEELRSTPLSHPALEAILRDEGSLQFATLGSGNHFIELQADESQQLWLMIHSGSRVMGQAIRDHHLARASAVGSGFKTLDVETDVGRAYARDVKWARQYADGNRCAMTSLVARVLHDEIGAIARWDTLIKTDHNHVALESHVGEQLWVHRKGAMPAGAGVPGVLPGSMGTTSFHIEGRGASAAMCSSAHGAGRLLSREAARRAVRERDVHRQMNGVWYDYRMARDLREEAPSVYKDIRAVVRAQSELVKIVRALRPILNYKGR